MSEEDEKQLITCPHCHTRYRADESREGEQICCQACEAPLRIELPAASGRFTDFQEGDVLGSYRITRRIGKGGMGTVYKAEHISSGKSVAIKSLHIDLENEASSEYSRRFLREARLAAAIRHPNVVHVTGFIKKDSRYHIVQEYVPGGSVKSLLMQKGTLPEKTAVEIALGTARALAEAAKVRIVHRDIKPDNIMLDDNGTAKLADLGLATQMHDADLGRTGGNTTRFLDKLFAGDSPPTSVSLTISNMAMGTPAYMAPEQAVDSRSVDGRADIYSLGATLYQMLCGDPPYMGTSLRDLISRHRHADIPDPRARRADLSERTAGIIMKCLGKKPEERYATAQQLADDLEKALAELAPRNTEAAAGVGKAVHFYEPEALDLPEPMVFTPPPPRLTQSLRSRADRTFSRENLIFLLALIIAGALIYGIYQWSEAYRQRLENDPSLLERKPPPEPNAP